MHTKVNLDLDDTRKLGKMASQKIEQNSQERTKKTPIKVNLIPTFRDEDPERTPEQWWLRRQNQDSMLI